MLPYRFHTHSNLIEATDEILVRCPITLKHPSSAPTPCSPRGGDDWTILPFMDDETRLYNKPPHFQTAPGRSERMRAPKPVLKASQKCARSSTGHRGTCAVKIRMSRRLHKASIPHGLGDVASISSVAGSIGRYCYSIVSCGRPNPHRAQKRLLVLYFHCHFIVITNGRTSDCTYFCSWRGRLMNSGNVSTLQKPSIRSCGLLRFGLTSSSIIGDAGGFVGRGHSAIHGHLKEDVLHLLGGSSR